MLGSGSKLQVPVATESVECMTATLHVHCAAEPCLSTGQVGWRRAHHNRFSGRDPIVSQEASAQHHLCYSGPCDTPLCALLQATLSQNTVDQGTLLPAPGCTVLGCAIPEDTATYPVMLSVSLS